ENSIAQLDAQLASDKQHLEQQLSETVPKSSYESLQQQLTERENSIAQLDAQLASAKQHLEQQLAE
ncbi:MAG: CopG family transcriptional regulator, partial [Microcoleus sp.]